MIIVNIIKCVSSHFRRDKTFVKIPERYHWKGMKNTINDYIQTWTKCFTVKAKISTEAPPLHPIPVPTKAWSLIGIDIIGPLQESVCGNKYIVAAKDHFSKWSEAAAIPKERFFCGTVLILCHMRLGCMDAIRRSGVRVCEQADRRIHSSLWHRSSHQFCLPPRSNGQQERDNCTLKDALTKLAKGTATTRTHSFPVCCLPISVHASTKHAPFETMYGRNAKLPWGYRPPTVTSDEDDGSGAVDQETLQCIVDIWQSLQSSITDNIKAAPNRQKEQYDRIHESGKTIDVGSILYIKNRQRIHRMSGMMKPHEAAWSMW